MQTIQISQAPTHTSAVLVTDLDGTLIPLKNNTQNIEALTDLAAHIANADLKFVYATGRHYTSVKEAMQQYTLPTPGWIICDVGTSIYVKEASGYKPLDSYQQHLSARTGNFPRKRIEEWLSHIAGLSPQDGEHQGLFKISYDCDVTVLDQLVDQVNGRLKQFELPYLCLGSIDPFENRGLLDVLPAGVDKSYAITWLSTHADFTPHDVVYAGDSGNDYAALCAFKSILVGNASEALAQRVKQTKAESVETTFYHAQGVATSGVVEGCKHYGLITSPTH